MPATAYNPVAISTYRAKASSAEWVRLSGTPFEAAKDQFVHWNRALAESESLWAEHVYSNPDFGEFDALQHSAMLHSVIGAGQMLLIDLIALRAPEQTESYIAAMKETLARLKVLLHEWHGPVSGSEDDFALAMREVAQGKDTGPWSMGCT